MHYTTNDEFNGEWNNGIKQGRGVYAFKNGDDYEGYWKNG